ncbi:hypothetical protein [Planosporangium mesophilum]|uniref:Uncharacterized protein n=1 Tax=Planosporangium mesophilum TaxID=689768 RepID=A0A8J3TDP4_9ACTN|nr:hypothetical protein [Planosporangium mesophilum]NJC84078.1 hypothetical protein [Planosporangium mesophilum]GII22919.1 hypothetical protein Pme01_25160 [Planosporangium mesophilum]
MSIDLVTHPSGADAVAYGFSRPTVDDVRTTVYRVYTGGAQGAWTELLQRAGLTGQENDSAAVERLVATAAASDDPVMVMCGQAHAIRLATHRRLVAVRDLVTAAAA